MVFKQGTASINGGQSGGRLLLGAFVKFFRPFEPDPFAGLKLVENPLQVFGQFEVDQFSPGKNNEIPFKLFPVRHSRLEPLTVFLKIKMHQFNLSVKIKDSIPYF
jgi:hypothetical protein